MHCSRDYLLDYNPQLDQIIVSVRRFNELWVIDHSTTTMEASGHTGGISGKGGDILYRWGNPAAHGIGTVADQKLFGQHDTQWIQDGLSGAGNILVFNNGTPAFGGPGYSTIEELVLPLNGFNYDYTSGQEYGPAAPIWHYESMPPSNFYSSFISGVQRLPNGNTLIAQGADGTVFEVSPSGEVVWRYVNPMTSAGALNWNDLPAGNSVFRATRYPIDYPAFAGKTLSPTGSLETWDSYANLTLASNEGGAVAREGVFSHGNGQLITLRAFPAADWSFLHWVVENGSAAINDVSASHTTFVMGNSDATIRAAFVPIINIPTIPGVGLIVMIAIFGITVRLVFIRQ